MPSRNQALVRRHINRLQAELSRHLDTQPGLAALHPIVTQHAEQLNQAWQDYLSIVQTGDQERVERDNAIDQLFVWVRIWRPLTLTILPTAKQSLKDMPTQNATPTDIIAVAKDLLHFLEEKEALANIREQAVTGLGTKLEDAIRETDEATASLRLEDVAQEHYSELSVEANRVLVHGLSMIRAIFGSTSPVYRQFIQNEPSAELDEEVAVGEGEGAQEDARQEAPQEGTVVAL